MNMKKELSKGSTSLLVLSVLESGDMYGYQIIKEIEARSEFVFSLKEGTLYPILHAFEKDGYVTSYWIENESARKRKYYRITDKGLEAYHAEQVRLRQCLTDAQRLENEEGSVCLNRKPEPSIDFRPVKAGT